MNFYSYIARQKEWSLKTFGEGKRTKGICKHIRMELKEIDIEITDYRKLIEVIDIIILAMDMAWRLGFSPEEIEAALLAKQEKNFRRKWPPKEVSEANQNKPTLHIKSAFE